MAAKTDLRLAFAESGAKSEFLFSGWHSGY